MTFYQTHAFAFTFMDWQNSGSIYVFPICGVPLDTYITVTIDSDGNASLRWGDAYGYTYKSWATSIYANKAVSLTADSAQERIEEFKQITVTS